MFNLQNIITAYDLQPEELQDILFPDVKFKKPALDRVLKENIPIDTVQLFALADYLGVSISKLYDESIIERVYEGNILTISIGIVSVFFNFKTGIYRNNVNKNIGVFSPVALTLEDIKIIINNLKNGTN